MVHGNKGKVRSPEARAKIASALLGRKLSEKTKEKISKSHIGLKMPPMSAKSKEKIRASRNGTKMSNETKEKIRASKLGKSHSVQHIEKLCVASVKRHLRNEKSFHKPLKYKDVWMRSTWEIKVAEWLDEHNISWEYETINCVHKLKNNHHYIIDFYLPGHDIFIEVKASWDFRGNEISKFVEASQTKDIRIVDKRNINCINLDLKTF